MKYKCSKCGTVFEGELNYCPHCGAAMRYGDQPPVKPSIRVNIPKTAPKQNVEKENGSFGGGFCLGFFLGLIGLIVGLCMSPDTKRGAGTGFVVNLLISIAIIIWQIILLKGQI